MTEAKQARALQSSTGGNGTAPIRGAKKPKSSKVTELEMKVNELTHKVGELSKKPYQSLAVNDDILLRKKLLLPVEAASILRCSVKTVYRKARRGELDAVEDRGFIRITSASILEILESATH